jgi:hypothetical protein
MTVGWRAENADVTVSVDGGEQCPSCGSLLVPDQRYCLECGHRRGDPRLPFMDAVVFMDAVKQPKAEAKSTPQPVAKDRRPLMSANASLVAGIGTLVLAIGVGVLIGRSGESGSAPAAAAPQIIKVGGGSETASTAEPEAEASAGKKGKGGKGVSKNATKKAQTGQSGATKATEEVFKPASGVKLAEPEVEKGGKCESGAAGCENGEFTGNFFGE